METTTTTFGNWDAVEVEIEAACALVGGADAYDIDQIMHEAYEYQADGRIRRVVDEDTYWAIFAAADLTTNN